MSEKEPTTNISRRSLLKTAGFGLAGAPVIGSLADTALAASELPYDKIENNEHSTTIRYTKNAVWHNYIKISVSSTVKHLGSSFTRDNRWNHKFGIDTQAIAYHTQDEKLRPNIKNQSTKVQKVGDSSLEINGKPVGSGYVGATPSDSNDDIENVFTTILESTASLLNQKFAVASAATSIANSLKAVGSQSCKSAADCTEYEWTYLRDKDEVAHQAKWWATTGEEEWGNFEVTTQADSETAISFAGAVGPDNGDVSPYDPPSQTSVQDETTDKTNPDYVTREELENLRNRDSSTRSGLSKPQTMSAETLKKYNVRKLDSTQTIVVDGKEKEATHVATNIPSHIVALEPEETFK